MRKTAIILGATGLTGNHLLQQLLNNEEYEKVKVLTRKEVRYNHPKLEEHIIDLLKLDDYADIFKGDVVFCCIGTTRAKTPDKEVYRAIDYGIPVEAARLAKENNINQYIVISALGADVNSKVFYNRLKGEMERDVIAQEIPQTYIMRPSLIVGNRKEKRTGEDISKHVMQALDFAIPKRYKPIQAKVIAQAMIKIAKDGYPETFTPSEKIKNVAKQNI